MSLLVNVSLYLSEIKDFIPKEAKVEISKYSLKAELKGDKIQNYEALRHIKSVTFNELDIKKTKSGFEAQVVVDI